MKNYITKTLMLLAVVLLAACSSDNDITDEPKQPTTAETTSTPITITARYGDGTSTTRVSYSESGNTISATWDAGDQIYVVYDGKVSTLTLTDGAGTTTATFSGTINHTNPLTASSVLACYVKDVNNASALTVSGNTLVYSDAAFTAQDGTMAGAAKCNIYSGTTTYGSGENLVCNFGVSTAICKFTLKQIAADYLYEATVAYKSGDNTLASATFTVSDGDNLVYLAVPAGSYSGTQKMVYSCATTSVTQESVISSTGANFAAGSTYSKDVTFRGGLFSVSETKTVLFSPGNLQATYDGNSWSWAFAANQWDYIGNNASNNCISDNGTVSTNGTVDLFKWSTDATYYGIHNSTSTITYRGSFKDWGTLAIGSYPADTWRTLTKDEWQYLLDHSTCGMATVNGVHGCIFLPDGCELNINTDKKTWDDNIISESEWNSTYRQERVLFLPAAGFHYIDYYVQWTGEQGYYWSSTKDDEGDARSFAFGDAYESSLYHKTIITGRYNGLSVRLVRNAE